MTEFNKMVLKKSLTAAFITGIISTSLISACATIPEQKAINSEEIKPKEPEASLIKVYVSMGRYVEFYSAKKIDIMEISGQKLIKLYLPDNKVINVINAPVLWESDK